MQLTKEQIQYIENRLINEGVKYWDIRIEMLDHIVTDVEKQLDYGNRFDEAVKNAMLKLGFKWKAVGKGFEELLAVKRKNITKQFNKRLKSETLKLIKNPLNIVLYGLFLYLMYSFPELKIYNWAMLVIIAFFFVLLVFALSNYKKFFKSISLGASFGLSFLTINLMNSLIYIPKLIVGGENSPYYLMFIVAIVLPLFFIETKVLFQQYKRTNNLYRKLFS